MFDKKNNQNDIILSAFLSFFCVYGLSREYVVGESSFVKANSFFTLLLWIILSALFYQIKKNLVFQEVYSSFPGAVILALSQRIGAEFSATKSLNLHNKNFYITCLAITIVFMSLFILLFRYWQTITKVLRKSILNRWSEKISNSNKFYFIIWIGLLICWIPAFLAVYPGIYSYDAGPQVWQIFAKAGLSAHHPVIHTLLLDGCFYLGHAITGNYNTGLLIYTLVQSVFMAACFAYAIYYMKKNRVLPIIQLVAFVFFAFNPINQIWVMTTTKDTIFAGFFLVLLVETWESVIHTEDFFASKKKVVKYVITAILMCLFRNQGIYVLALLVPFVVFTMKKYRKQFLVILLIPIVVVKVITGPISNMLGIESANPREALSVPIQQLARAVTMNPDKVSEEEKEVIYQYIPKEYVDTYNPVTSDTVKEGFNRDLFEKDSKTFFKTWLSVGLKNKGIYLDSFLFGSYGYFYMDESPYWISFILYDGAWLDEGQNILNIQRESKFPLYDKYLRAVSYGLVQERVPVISTVSNEAFPFLILVVVASVLLYQRKLKKLLPLLLVFGFWGTMLLGPLIAIRYAYPIIVCVPSMLAVLYYENNNK